MSRVRRIDEASILPGTSILVGNAEEIVVLVVAVVRWPNESCKETESARMTTVTRIKHYILEHSCSREAVRWASGSKFTNVRVDYG